MIDPQAVATAYAYDSLNRLTTLTYPARTSCSFTYDALSRRTQLTRPNGVGGWPMPSAQRIGSIK